MDKYNKEEDGTVRQKINNKIKCYFLILFIKK